MSGARASTREGALHWVPTADVPDGGIRVLLGEQAGRTWWALLLGRQPGDGWVPLRGLLPHLVGTGAAAAPLALHAFGLAEWHLATRHCTRCGGSLAPARAGHELVCADCGRSTFPRTDPAVIMTVTHGEPGAADERCLLGHRVDWPEGRFSTLAGFCEPGETLEDAVRREVLEEVGVEVDQVAFFGNQAWPLPSSLMLGCTARATSMAPVTADVEDEIAESRWFTREELRAGAASGEISLPAGVSISRSLIEAWHGSPLPGSW